MDASASDSCSAAVAAASSITLFKSLAEFRAEVDAAVAGEAAAVAPRRASQRELPDDIVVSSMRAWIRENGAKCWCFLPPAGKRGGRPRASPVGCKLHWRKTSIDVHEFPPPHNVSLLTRFCHDVGFKKERRFTRLFQEALLLEGFQLARGTATERNLILGNRTRVEFSSGFVYNWIDARDQAYAVQVMNDFF